ncbi:MAG: hypothetical protein ABL917_02040 [Parcubacteria group bacterium]
MRLNKFGIVLVILVVVSVTSSIVFYVKASKLESGKKSSLSVETENLIKEVSKLIVLPEDEDPTIATVSDPLKVRNQPFFANAVAGDKVLIYLKSRKAFLYSPKLKKLIEVAPLSPENSSLSESVGTTTPKNN